MTMRRLLIVSIVFLLALQGGAKAGHDGPPVLPVAQDWLQDYRNAATDDEAEAIADAVSIRLPAGTNARDLAAAILERSVPMHISVFSFALMVYGLDAEGWNSLAELANRDRIATTALCYALRCTPGEDVEPLLEALSVDEDKSAFFRREANTARWIHRRAFEEDRRTVVELLHSAGESGISLYVQSILEAGGRVPYRPSGVDQWTAQAEVARLWRVSPSTVLEHLDELREFERDAVISLRDDEGVYHLRALYGYWIWPDGDPGEHVDETSEPVDENDVPVLRPTINPRGVSPTALFPLSLLPASSPPCYFWRSACGRYGERCLPLPFLSSVFRWPLDLPDL